MRLLRLVALVVLILALTPAPAAAADIRSGQEIVVGTAETIDDDLYAFGTNISINGTINGDLIAAGSNVTIDGTVTGDVIAAANNVIIRGQVGGSVRAAGTNLNIDGKVGKDVVAGGVNVNIQSNGRVGRDVVAGATSTNVQGQIGRDLQAGSTSVEISGTVGRDVLAQATDIKVIGTGSIGGKLKYTSPNEAKLASASSVKGGIEHRTPDPGPTPLVTGPAALAVEWLKGLIGLLILGILVVFFFPGFSRRAGEALVHSPWLTLAIGALVLIGLPILSIVFFAVGALIGGWWIGFVVLALFTVVLALSLPIAAVGVGGAILRVARRPVPVWFALLIGLVALLLVALVPILGGLVIFCALLFGMGATTIAVVGNRRAEVAAA